MTEDDARSWIATRFGEAKTACVAAFLDMVRIENGEQNLIAPSTVESIWVRHALDSAQLIDMAGKDDGRWLDIGTGGGFPGIVVAILFDGMVTMVEPRKRRVAFLQDCIARLDLARAQVMPAKVEQFEGQFDIISARAVASVEKLLQAAARCATARTCWVLPRGRIEPEQLESLRRNRQWMFHVKQSLTDAGSSILVGEPKS
ncbi:MULTISPECIES: 16S rRNA (guanine(527)-N(7))-methyltransferase RsmG [unclassified Sphingomonas]|nr:MULTISPECIES: 16S rRNA (guanine(527)-N(7))-methyltransferase RsmG [unclassified Sphingomonas]AXJ95275.1 16S rRNA (guanine(527)-N(7))-methyltransferase RsmG [Sphingomonas sp. FARSPH]